MKSFVKYTFATVVGIFITLIIFSVISIVSVAGMIATQGVTAPIKDGSILKIDMAGELTERADENPFAALLGDMAATQSLEDALLALKKAAKSDKIKGVFLCGSSLATQPAMAQELRQALLEFKKSGKWIVAYGDSYSKTAYYLASVADSILLNPEGVVEFNGMATELMFYKDVMDKLGIKMQVFKVGTYKSAVEPFIASEMSPANREQVTSYLTSIWNNMLQEVAESRHMDATRLNTLADTQTAFSTPGMSLNNGLVDALCYMDQVKTILQNKCGLDEDEELTFASITDVAKSETLDEKVDKQVAVYYAYGEIVQTPAPSQ